MTLVWGRPLVDGGAACERGGRCDHCGCFLRRDHLAGVLERLEKTRVDRELALASTLQQTLMARTTSGSLVVNHNLIQSGTNPYLPFGGVNASGQGRIGGRYTFLECSNARSVVEDQYPAGDPNIMFPPYSDKYKKMIAQLLAKEIKMPDAAINLINGIIKVTSVFKRG